MKLTRLDPRAAVALTPDAVDEALRAFISAWGVVSSRVLLDRVVAQLDASADHQALVRSRLDALEDCGDVLAGPRGMIAAAPVFEVAMAGGQRLLVGAAPDRVLRESFPEVVLTPGAPRRVVDGVSTEALTARFGGLSVTGARWAGLDDTLRADEALLASLRSRAAAAEEAGALEALDPSAERYLTASARGTRTYPWRGDLEAGMPAVVRWGGLAGEPRFGWAVSPSQVFALGRDEALRATWALERTIAGGVQLAWEVGETSVDFTLTARLPAAEYRYLTASGATRSRDGGRWSVPTAAWPDVLAVLRDRLGVEGSERIA